jgi:hypothetical protein
VIIPKEHNVIFIQFAGAAMAALLTNPVFNRATHEEIAQLAFEHASAMVEKLEELIK